MVIVVGGARKVTDRSSKVVARAPSEASPTKVADKTSKVTDSIAKMMARAPNEA
ncbi:hypothetical protein [Lysinibacillus fusiformis]|uniref:hypothetical protein n=1 Tax=Lysinibacillus fusiformis TaxID=28031 RepID=UPI001585F828|nr:hypothetical protein [Lysinibacillus fusiformis]